MEKIESTKNPLVRLLSSLKDKSGREREGMMLVEGAKMVEEALSCALKAHYLFVGEGGHLKMAALVARCAQAGARIYEVPERILKAISDTVTPQGVIGAFETPPALSLDSASGCLVALDGVQDPGNVGTIWRTADAAGYSGILLGQGSADALSPKVQRAAMGSGFRLPAWNASSLTDALDALRGRHYQVIAAALGGDSLYGTYKIGVRHILIIGSEARGVSEDVLGRADLRLTIPMRGGAESLNAAVAAGIAMYELTRRAEIY